jgi:hypothetical protein
MFTKQIVWFGRSMVLGCDGNCAKAWGFSQRPKERVGKDQDDVAYLADGELGEAPERPGTYEGGHSKPDGPHAMNKWCSRECERSDIAPSVEKLSLADWSKRVLNQPWKHAPVATTSSTA